MLQIHCPWCGPRDEIEFRCGGESHIARPAGDGISDAEWAAYLFERDNPRRERAERWVHSGGCRQWFNVVRDAVTHEIYEVYEVGARSIRLEKPRD